MNLPSIAFDDPMLDDFDEFEYQVGKWYIDHNEPMTQDELTNLFIEMRTLRNKTMMNPGCGTKTGCSTNGNDIP